MSSLAFFVAAYNEIGLSIQSATEKGIFSFNSLYNVFTQLAEVYFPDFEYYQKSLYGLGCKHVSLSGTGPVLFALFQTKEAAAHVCESLLQKGIKAYCVQSVNFENVNNG